MLLSNAYKRKRPDVENKTWTRWSATISATSLFFLIEHAQIRSSSRFRCCGWHNRSGKAPTFDALFTIFQSAVTVVLNVTAFDACKGESVFHSGAFSALLHRYCEADDDIFVDFPLRCIKTTRAHGKHNRRSQSHSRIVLRVGPQFFWAESVSDQDAVLIKI